MRDSVDIIRTETEAFTRAADDAAFLETQYHARGAFSGTHVIVGEGAQKRWCLDFTGVSYLGLDQSWRLRFAYMKGVFQLPLGPPAAQEFLHTQEMQELKAATAAFHDMPDGGVTIGTSGFPANHGTMEALGLRLQSHLLAAYQEYLETDTKHLPTVFLCYRGYTHFSCSHPIRMLARAYPQQTIFGQFNGPDDLRAQIKAARDTYGEALVIIVTDSVNSVDGTIVDIRSLCGVAQETGCLVYVDEAHAVGVVGPRGRGVVAGILQEEPHFRDRLIVMGNYSKVLSGSGGYVVMPVGNQAEYLARGNPFYLFSAPLPPPTAAALTTSLAIVQGETGERLRQNVFAREQQLRDGLRVSGLTIAGNSAFPIVSIRIGDEKRAARMQRCMQEHAVLVSLFAHPLTPKGAAVLRFSCRADHTPAHIDHAIAATRTAVRVCG